MTDYGPAGNTYDKFNTQNPISRQLVKGFTNSLQELLSTIKAKSVLEVGCGEGYIQQLISQYDFIQLFAFDIDAPIVYDAQKRHPTSHYFVGNGEHLPFPDDAFDLVMAIEVLEHVPDPDQVLSEMARVSNRYCIVSVPREPIWRLLNIARGKYVTTLGNTPGHVQHWGSQGFKQLVQKHFRVIDVKQPLPWTMVLAENWE